MNIKRILCPVDFSDASTHAIDQAVAFASWCKARLTVLHGCSPMHLSDTGLEMAGPGEATNNP